MTQEVHTVETTLFQNTSKHCPMENMLVSFEISKKQGFSLTGIIVAPALAGRHRRASFRTFVRSYVRPSVHPSTFNIGIL